MNSIKIEMFRIVARYLLVSAIQLNFIMGVFGADESLAADGRHLGTWRLSATKYGDATDFTPYPESSKRLKFITATHFIWVEVRGKEVTSSAGGTYKLAGDLYSEMLDFGGEGMEEFLGKEQKFTIRVEGEKLFQSGQLSNGLKIEEIWERAKK